MLDIGWSEILVIAVVMIVIVGPKDLPKMLRAFGKATSRMRSTANDFKKQFDEALREAELEDVKTIIEETRKLDPRKNMTKVFEPIRSAGEDLRSSLNQSPKPTAEVEKTKDDEGVEISGADKKDASVNAGDQQDEPAKPAFTISDPEPSKQTSLASVEKKAVASETVETAPSGKSAKATSSKKADSSAKPTNAAAKPAVNKAAPAKKPAAKTAPKTAAKPKTKTVKETETKA